MQSAKIIDELNSSSNLQIKQGKGELRPLDAVVCARHGCLWLTGM